MASAADLPPLEDRRHFAWEALPSWLLSLVVHASIVVPLALVIRTEPVPKGLPSELSRSVGIVSEVPDAASANVGAEAPAEAAPAQPAEQPNRDPTVVNAAPPVPLQLPDSPTSPQRLGPGPMRPPTSLPAVGRDVLKPGTGAGPRGVAALGKGKGTQFFQVEAEGSSFVYVIDASGSMSEHNALSVAKAELLASMQHLTANHQFQVVFYNDDAYAWKREGSKPQLFFATDINKNLVSQFVQSFASRGGTRHMTALEAALRFNPEVIYFLTDAKEPELTPAELEKIQRRCASHTTIHTIEFGVGESIRADNFLKKLARATGGKSGYRDVQKFD